MIVDDESAITSALTSLFTRAGYETAMASSGPDALSLLSWKPDLVILDVRLPGMDGFAVCRQIRQTPTYLPVVMLTAKDEASDKVAGLELGADIYLTKPFEPSSLLAQVRALLRLVEQNAGSVRDRPLI
ncbi:MAG: response regulator, partial [Nitrososphaera sp.]|nr:response regulator [Nitrososphaera sp.]